MSLTGVQEANSQMEIYRNAHALVFLCIYFYLYSLFSNFRPIVQGNSDFSKSGKSLLVNSGILGFGIRNTARGIRNSANDWNP